MKCDKCGSDMVEKSGRYGPFTACSNFPQCKNTKNINPRLSRFCSTKVDYKIEDPRFANRALREANRDKNILKEEKRPPVETKEVCEKCGEGKLLIRQGRFGEFLACSRYPKCHNTKKIKAN